MRIMGLDWGEKRIGVSISDPLGITAQPLPYIYNDSKLIENLTGLLNKYGIETVILGNPLMLSGRPGISADKVRHFHEMLSSKLPVKISIWDERLTSKAAERSLIEAGVSRKKRKGVIDSSSACLMLQSYMDHKIYAEK